MATPVIMPKQGQSVETCIMSKIILSLLHRTNKVDEKGNANE